MGEKSDYELTLIRKMDIGSIFSKIVLKYKVIGKNKDRAVRKGCFFSVNNSDAREG